MPMLRMMGGWQSCSCYRAIGAPMHQFSLENAWRRVAVFCIYIAISTSGCNRIEKCVQRNCFNVCDNAASSNPVPFAERGCVSCKEYWRRLCTRFNSQPEIKTAEDRAFAAEAFQEAQNVAANIPHQEEEIPKKENIEQIIVSSSNTPGVAPPAPLLDPAVRNQLESQCVNGTSTACLRLGDDYVSDKPTAYRWYVQGCRSENICCDKAQSLLNEFRKNYDRTFTCARGPRPGMSPPAVSRIRELCKNAAPPQFRVESPGGLVRVIPRGRFDVIINRGAAFSYIGPGPNARAVANAIDRYLQKVAFCVSPDDSHTLADRYATSIRFGVGREGYVIATAMIDQPHFLQQCLANIAGSWKLPIWDGRAGVPYWQYAFEVGIAFEAIDRENISTSVSWEPVVRLLKIQLDSLAGNKLSGTEKNTMAADAEAAITQISSDLGECYVRRFLKEAPLRRILEGRLVVGQTSIGHTVHIKILNDSDIEFDRCISHLLRMVNIGSARSIQVNIEIEFRGKNIGKQIIDKKTTNGTLIQNDSEEAGDANVATPAISSAESSGISNGSAVGREKEKEINDIKRWRHPTKGVFLAKGFPIQRVRLIGTYPYFGISGIAKLKGAEPSELKDFYDSVCSANFGFSFAIEEVSGSAPAIRVECDRKKKAAVSWN